MLPHSIRPLVLVQTQPSLTRSGGPADSNGDDNIALVTEASGYTFDYGNSLPMIRRHIWKPRCKGTGNWHEFEDGRAERVATQTTGVTSSTSSAGTAEHAELFLAGLIKMLETAI